MADTGGTPMDWKPSYELMLADLTAGKDDWSWLVHFDAARDTHNSSIEAG